MAEKENSFEDLGIEPKIEKNEVIEGPDYNKSLKKYEGETPFPILPIIIAIIIIILAVIFLF
jgi:hypothetical protein